MILKEAFRYQNFLSDLINSAISYLSYTENVTTKKQAHLRHKVNQDAEDETINVPKKSDIEQETNQIIQFVLHLLSEKETLSNAIDKAKLSSSINIDSAIALNKQKQSVSTILTRISTLKSSEKVVRGIDYMFNAERNQVPYNYDVKEEISIDFDRDKVRKIIKKLNNEADDTSYKVDRVMIELEVDYTPIYDVNDCFEEVLTDYVGKNTPKVGTDSSKE